MRDFIGRLLEFFGLATTRRVRGLVERVSKLEMKLGRTGAALESSRADAHGWKQRAEDAGKQLAAAEREIRKIREALDASKAKSEAQAAELAIKQARVDTLLGQLRDLKGKVERTDRTARATSEHILATEMKLDLVEAAIHLLDMRTRAGTPTPMASRPQSSAPPEPDGP